MSTHPDDYNIHNVIIVPSLIWESMPSIEKYFRYLSPAKEPIEGVTQLVVRSAYRPKALHILEAMITLKVPMTYRERVYDATAVTESPFHIHDGYWTTRHFRYMENGKRDHLADVMLDSCVFSALDLQMAKTAIMRETINPVLGKL